MLGLENCLEDLEEIKNGKEKMQKIIKYNKKLLKDKEILIGLTADAQEEIKVKLKAQIKEAESVIAESVALEEELKALVYLGYKDDL